VNEESQHSDESEDEDTTTFRKAAKLRHTFNDEQSLIRGSSLVYPSSKISSDKLNFLPGSNDFSGKSFA
jgi:hypothetical protein